MYEDFNLKGAWSVAKSKSHNLSPNVSKSEEMDSCKRK